MRTKEEQDASDKKFAERSHHYMRLDFAYTLEDIDDDQLWEKAKNLPIDAPNRADLDDRAALESKKLAIAMHEGLQGEELLKMEEDFRKIAKEAQSRKLISKEELLELIKIREAQGKKP